MLFSWCVIDYLFVEFHLDWCSSCETDRTPRRRPAAPERSPPSGVSWPEVPEVWEASEERYEHNFIDTDEEDNSHFDSFIFITL